MKRLIVLLLLVPFISGCSVGMALHGKREPDMGDLRKGMSIEEAHFILRDYEPAISFTDDGDRIEEYKIELGNKPSGGRALGHLAMDVFTLGLWEIVGTPVEAMTSGDMRLKITYRDDKIIKISAGKKEEGL